jgi:hypothetical protein
MTADLRWTGIQILSQVWKSSTEIDDVLFGGCIPYLAVQLYWVVYEVR